MVYSQKHIRVDTQQPDHLQGSSPSFQEYKHFFSILSPFFYLLLCVLPCFSKILATDLNNIEAMIRVWKSSTQRKNFIIAPYYLHYTITWSGQLQTRPLRNIHFRFVIRFLRCNSAVIFLLGRAWAPTRTARLFIHLIQCRWDIHALGKDILCSTAFGLRFKMKYTLYFC